MAWRIPATLWRGVGGIDLQALGLPSEAEHLRACVQRTGRDAGDHREFYMAYNLFRMAAILHGIGERAAQGNAAAADALETASRAAPLAAIGWQPEADGSASGAPHGLGDGRLRPHRGAE